MRKSSVVLGLLIAALGCVAAHAGERDFHVTSKLGFNLGGDFNVDPPDADVDVDAHFLWNVDVDAKVADKLSVGGRMKLGFPSVGDESETYFAIGPVLKAHFKPDPKLSLSPGFAVLYQTVSGVGRGDSVNGLGLELFLEAGTPITHDLDFVGELGFNAQPTGGNGDVTVTWGPMFHLMAGIRY